MKESKAVYVTRHKIRDDQNIVYQLNTSWNQEYGRPNRYHDNYIKNNEFACQFDSKKDTCICRNAYGREVIYFSNIPKQVYAYHGSRSSTDVGVGSVKILQRRKVKRVYLPETDDRGVGSSDLSTYTFIRRTRPYKGSFYDHKKTSSKCVGGIIEYTGCVLSEKLSPINNTKSGTTSPKIPDGHKNIEIGSNTVVKNVETVGTQFESEDNEEKHPPNKEELVKIAKVSETQQYKNTSRLKKIEKKIKEAERQFSSDSLVQNVHDLEVPSEDKPSSTSMDPMENKLEREYRRIFTTKDKDSKSSCDKHIPELKSASVLRRRFEALRRGLTKKDDLKKSSFIPKSSQSRESLLSRRDASVTSDPPSLEARSFSDAKRYSPLQANVIEQEKPRLNNNYRNETDSIQYATEMDSDYQGVRGMFKLWGKKFNLEEDSFTKKQATPLPSYDAPIQSEKVIENREIVKKESEKRKPELESKKERRFFFFKKKTKDQPKNPYHGSPKKKTDNVTAGRCEIADGLTLKMGRPNTPTPKPKEKTPKVTIEEEEITRKRWLRGFLSNTIESARSVNVRWNNTTYATSSSTVFKIIDTVYKNTENIIKSHSEMSSLESYYRSNTNKNRVNFIQDIQAWMIPKTTTDRPKEIPIKLCSKHDISSKNIELSYFDQKWFIDQSKTLSHKIEVVIHSKNLNVKRKVSSEYLRIDIPKDFFDHLSSDESKRNQTSDEEVYKIVEYESDTEKKVKENIRMEKRANSQSDIKVVVSVQDSESKIVETVIKRPPTHRDVIIQGSNVNIPQRCDVIGVGIITQRDLREMSKPILKFQDVLSSEDSDPPPLLEQKKCEFAEHYLQEYYKHLTPLGLDLSSCVSDSHLKSCSEKSLSFHNQQGDASKPCPNIGDDYQMPTSSNEASSESYNEDNNHTDNVNIGNDRTSSKFVNFMKKKEKDLEKVKKDKDGDDSGKRFLSKDSLEVFKKRKLYAHSNKSQWICPDDNPVSIPSCESRGEQDYQDNRGEGVCHSDECPKALKPVFMAPVRKRVCKKHVSMPDCETLALGMKKQVAETHDGILNFKGSVGCDMCKKKATISSKHATVRVKPSLEIPEPPCKVICIKNSKAACLQPSSPSCNTPPEDILCPPPPRQKPAACPGFQPPLKCPTPPSYSPTPPSYPPTPPSYSPTSPKYPPSPPRRPSSPSRLAPTVKSPPKNRPTPIKAPSPSMIPQQSQSPPCPSPSKTTKPTYYPHIAKSPRSPNNPPCPAMKPDGRGVVPSCPSMEPQCPSKMPNPLPPPPCPSSLPTCQRPSRTIFGSISKNNSLLEMFKRKKTCPYCTDTKKSSSNTSCRGCLALKKKKSKKNKKIECCSPSSCASICPSTHHASPIPSPKSPKCTKCSQCRSSDNSSSSEVPTSPLSSMPHPPKPKPTPKLSPCNKPPCSKIETKPSNVDGKNTKCKEVGCGQEFPWPINSNCSNQPSPKTSEGCFEKLINKIKDSKSECKKNCAMMKASSDYPDPDLKRDECQPQYPSVVKVVDPGHEQNKKKLFSGLFLRKNPSKKKTCAKECSAWKNVSSEPEVVRLNSREKITIRLKEQTPSTEEIRECVNIKVKDEDGQTLYERKDYSTGNKRSSVCGNVYDSKLNRLSTPAVVTNLASESQQDVSNTKSEQSLSNLVEIQFKLRIVHGNKATETDIAKDDDQEEKNDGIENAPEVYSVKNDEREEISDESNPKNDVSIKIIIKNYKPKSEKRKSEKEKQAADEYYNKISQKFNTVSTGYSEPMEENENVFSVHRATINLTSSTEKSKNQSATSIEKSKTHSAVSNKTSKAHSSVSNESSKAKSHEKSGTHSAVSNDVDDTIEPTEQEPSNTKSKTSYTVPSLSNEELVLITEDEATDCTKSNLQAYDTHYEYLRETYSNYFNRAHVETLQKEEPETIAVKSEEKVQSNSKENSKIAKKALLKKVFQRAHSKPKTKGRVRQLRDMLKIILTDSSTNDDLTMNSNELVKDVDFKSSKPNYFRGTDSMNNCYKMESAISSLKIQNILLEPNNYPTRVNTSDETEDSEEAVPKHGGCMCSKVVEKIKDPSLNISCCCRKKTKQDGEVNCDLYEDCIRPLIDAETQKSSIINKVRSNKSTNIPGTIVTKIREFTTSKIEKLKPFNKEDNQIDKTISDSELSNEKHKKDVDNIILMDHETKRTGRRKKTNHSNAADILQCYETKKAVLEIYAEKTVSKHGEHLVAKLPKFLYEKESEIERNYEKIATNSYVSVRTKNVLMSIEK